MVNDKAFLDNERDIWKKHISDVAKDTDDKMKVVINHFTSGYYSISWRDLLCNCQFATLFS